MKVWDVYLWFASPAGTSVRFHVEVAASDVTEAIAAATDIARRPAAKGEYDAPVIRAEAQLRTP